MSPALPYTPTWRSQIPATPVTPLTSAVLFSCLLNHRLRLLIISRATRASKAPRIEAEGVEGSPPQPTTGSGTRCLLLIVGLGKSRRHIFVIFLAGKILIVAIIFTILVCEITVN